MSDIDLPLPEDGLIADAHPRRTGRHELYEEAMRLVGAKQSKGALVELVNWLLSRVREDRDQERWIRYAREAERANLHNVRFLEDATKLEAMTRIQHPTITMMREELVRFRADYYALLILAAELLGKDPSSLTVGDAFFAMVARYTPPREEDG